ncbi:MAG: PEP-CTERM sorting domain-containing protein [Phycisphaerae bacterium]|nr:PEP-CTERM sorting domain-containing protein [Phycisphaerales bacterium]
MNTKSSIALMRLRKLLIVGLCVAFTSSAYASQLGSNFIGPFTNSPTLATVPRGGAVTVEVTWTQNASEAGVGLAALGFKLTSVPENPAPGIQGDFVEDPDLLMHGVSVTLPGWVNGEVPGTVGRLAEFHAGASALRDSLITPGTTVVGTFQISVGPVATLGLHPFYILRNPSLNSPDVLGGNLSNYLFSSPPTSPGTYEIGGGFAGSNVDVLRTNDAIPLVVNVVPEPATLALLAMGGLMVLRRRRPSQ